MQVFDVFGIFIIIITAIKLVVIEEKGSIITFETEQKKKQKSDLSYLSFYSEGESRGVPLSCGW